MDGMPFQYSEWLEIEQEGERMENPRAVWKAIMRNHPFFKDGGMFGFDFRTMRISYPRAANILRRAIEQAGEYEGVVEIERRPTATLVTQGDKLRGYLDAKTEVDGVLFYRFVLTRIPSPCFGFYAADQKWWVMNGSQELEWLRGTWGRLDD